MHGATLRTRAFAVTGGMILVLGGAVERANAGGTVSPPSCPGDANADGVVNFDDINSVLGNLLSVCPQCEASRPLPKRSQPIWRTRKASRK